MLQTKRGLLIAGMVVAGALCMGLWSRSQGPAPSVSTVEGTPSAPNAKAPAPPSGVQVIHIEGYPLDRSLKGLADYPKLDAALLLTEVKLGQPHWTTPDGAAPLYIAQNRPPNQDEMRRNDLIVTPVTGTVSEVLRGSQFSAGDEVSFVVAGGRVGTVQVQADEEIAPNLDQLSRGGTILLAGEVRKTGVIASFVYQLEADGASVRSLLKSASDRTPDFSLPDLKQALAEKQ